MKKWEYKVTQYGASLPHMEREFNELGAKGWEVVNFAVLPIGFRVIFKREILEPQELEQLHASRRPEYRLCDATDD